MLWAVIMAGGSGTRFWPESRRKNPKQFLRIFGKRTLLEETTARLGKAVPPSRIIVVAQNEKVSQVRRLLKAVPPRQIFGEPVGRNTAPCAVLAAAIVSEKDSEAVVALLPADHSIKNVLLFQKALKAAYEIAQREKYPVTFGIKPAFPHTGYGYLELNRLVQRDGRFLVYRLKRFHEKPDLKKAAAFFHWGRFLWNSGMFVWRADELLRAAEAYLPEAYRLIHKMMAHGIEKGMRRFYRDMPNISIDYGLMEKMRGKILTIPVELGWNDVGGWNSLAELRSHDKNQNVTVGKVLLIESTGNIVKANDRLIALVGMKDHVVIDTRDALLVCPRQKTESIRKVVEELKNRKWTKYL
jgi:mannose-1-phosphate guanylyltransferase